MKKWMILIMVVAFSSVFFVAQHAYSKETCPEKFKRYDVNHDGMVSMDEFKENFDAGEYAGTVPAPSGKPDAFAVFEALGGTKDKAIDEAQFCSGKWN
ncbi:MAG: hypothetical protein WCA08_04245 [Desulfoferrobacter sp.]